MEHLTLDPNKYDQIRRRGWLFRRKIAELAELVSNTEADSKILEIGTGTGVMIKQLNNIISDRQYFGIDVDKKLIHYAAINSTEIKYFIHNLETSPLKSKFDFAFIYDVIHHIKPKLLNKFVSNLRASLKPGSKVFICEPNSNNWYMKRMQIIKDDDLHFSEKVFEKAILGKFRIVSKQYRFLIPPFISNPPSLLRYLEGKFENRARTGAAVCYLLD